MRVGFRSHKHTKNCLLSVVSLDRSRRAVRDARSRTRGGVDLDAAPAADRERASAGGRARRGRRGRAFSDARVRRRSEEKPSAPPVANDISERRARGERRVRPPSRGPARPRLSHRGARRGDGRAIGLDDASREDPSAETSGAGAGQTRSTDREDAIGTLGTDPMSDEWTAGARQDEDARRRRDRDRMLYMSPIRAKMTPAVLDGRDANLDQAETNPRSATSASEQKDKTRDAFSAKKAENAQTTFEGASDFDVKDAP